MISAAIPLDEVTRMRSLRRLDVLDTEPEAQFDALVRAASLVCGAPISLISLVDADRQWFKAKHGLNVAETPREVAFCAHAILHDDIFEVPDTTQDARFRDNPLVTSSPDIRSYAGVPLKLDDGQRVGTLCVIGQTPRVLDATQRAILCELGAAAAKALELRRSALAERQSIEAKARAAEIVTSMFALSPDGFAALEESGTVGFCSAQFRLLARMGEQVFTGRPLPDLLAHLIRLTNGASVPALGEQPWALMIEASNGTEAQTLELSLHGGKSSPLASLLRLRDVSKQHANDRMRSEFLGVAAHELRTPMTVIFGYAELLLKLDMPRERQLPLLENMHRQCALMMEITTEFLDLALLEARGGRDIVRTSQDLLKIVQLAIADYKAPAGRSAPILTLHGTAPAVVRGDRLKLRQLFVNILSNAYKYSPDGGAVSVTVHTASRSVHLEIEDCGIGMTPEQLSHVSEKFFRADRSGAIPGTGLGMSIVKEIVALHEGSVEITSELGVGTKVSVLLPADRGDSDVAAVRNALFGVKP